MSTPESTEPVLFLQTQRGHCAANQPPGPGLTTRWEGDTGEEPRPLLHPNGLG